MNQYETRKEIPTDFPAEWKASHEAWNVSAMWQRGYYGASPIADRIVNLARTRRALHITDTQDYIEFVESTLTGSEWKQISYQARTLAYSTQKYQGVDLPYDLSYAITYKHLLDETAEGFSREARAMEWVKTYTPLDDPGYWVFTSQAVDKQYAIDLTKRRGGRIVQAVSVKPESYGEAYFTNELIWKNRHLEHQHHDAFKALHPDALVLMMWETDYWKFRSETVSAMDCAICKAKKRKPTW